MKPPTLLPDQVPAVSPANQPVVINALYQKGLIKPLSKVALPENTKVRLRIVTRVTIKGYAQVAGHPKTVLDEAETIYSNLQVPVRDTGKSGKNYLEFVLIGLIMLAAAIINFYHLGSLPTGAHGDEAVAGLEAERILREGYIGPYSSSALGQPTGPLYINTIPVWLFGHTMLALRFLPAFISILTVGLFCLLIRRNLGFKVAIPAGLLLATMNWHFHYARIGFPLASWPFVIILLCLALMEAIRRNQIKWWAITGALVGAGVYIYNAHTLFIAITGLFILLHLSLQTTAPLDRRIKWLTAFSGALIGISLPMILFAAQPENGYFDHLKQFSLFNNSEWTSLTTTHDRAALLLSRYIGWWDQLSFHPSSDGSDGMGIISPVPGILFALSICGVVLAFIRRRESLIYFGGLVLLLMPLAAVFTVSGTGRRTIPNALFLAMFAAIGLVEITETVRRRQIKAYKFALVSSYLLIGVIAYQSIHGYFATFATAESQAWVFAEELSAASRYMNTLPAEKYVYFYAGRWPFDYETRLWLAPNIKGEERAKEFGHFDLNINPQKGQPVFILIGDYKNLLPELQRRYPGGQVHRWQSPNTSFIAYEPNI